MAQSTKEKAKETTKKVVKKTKEAANKAGDFVLSNPKTISYILLAGLGIYGLYKIANLFKNAGVGGADDPDAGGGNVDTTNPNEVPAGATISKGTAQILAAEILSAVDSIGGVNEEEYMIIENALKGRTFKDYQLISEAFGTPRRSPFTGEESVWWLLGENLNLTQWLTVELDDEQKTRLHNAAPLIWP